MGSGGGVFCWLCWVSIAARPLVVAGGVCCLVEVLALLTAVAASLAAEDRL